MKSFKKYLIETILRRPDKETVSALSNSGAFTSKSGEPLKFTVYHGGHFGEGEGVTPTKEMISFPETKERWNEVNFNPEIRITRNQPSSTGLGLSTTPNAIAARQYRLKGYSTVADHTSSDFKSPALGKLYGIDISIKPERLKIFKEFSDMEQFVNTQTNPRKNPHYAKWLEDNEDSLKDFIDDGKRRKYLTDVHGIDAFAIHSGSQGAKKAGEVLLLNRDIITDIRDHTEDVDRVRERMSKASHYANVPGNIPVVDRAKRLKGALDDIQDRINDAWRTGGLEDPESKKIIKGQDPHSMKVRSDPFHEILQRFKNPRPKSNRPKK